MNEEILSRLISLARETAWSDDEEFDPYDKSDDYDDAYYNGSLDGEIHLARWILDSMGIGWES